MAERPVIVIVDDEPDALAAMLDALTRRFGGDYRVVPHSSARAALGAIAKIKEEKEEIALVIADQRMPEITQRARCLLCAKSGLMQRSNFIVI